MSETELKLPVRLMNLEALRSEEDRLIHEVHALRERLDAVRLELMMRLEDESAT